MNVARCCCPAAATMVPSMWTMGLKPHELIIHILLLGVPASIVSKFYQRGVRRLRPPLAIAGDARLAHLLPTGLAGALLLPPLGHGRSISRCYGRRVRATHAYTVRAPCFLSHAAGAASCWRRQPPARHGWPRWRSTCGPRPPLL